MTTWRQQQDTSVQADTETKQELRQKQKRLCEIKSSIDEIEMLKYKNEITNEKEDLV